MFLQSKRIFVFIYLQPLLFYKISVINLKIDKKKNKLYLSFFFYYYLIKSIIVQVQIFRKFGFFSSQ